MLGEFWTQVDPYGRFSLDGVLPPDMSPEQGAALLAWCAIFVVVGWIGIGALIDD